MKSVSLIEVDFFQLDDP